MPIKGQCDVDTLFTPLSRPKKKFTEDELSDLQKRWNRLAISVKSTIVSPNAIVEKAKVDVAAKQSEWMLRVGAASNLKPRNTGQLQDFMAKNFAIDYEVINNRKLTEAGEVRETLYRTKTIVASDVFDKIASIETLKQLQKAQDSAYRTMRDLPSDLRDSLWLGAMEEGQTPRILAASGYSPIAAREMNNKYNDFVKEAQSAGLTEQQVQDVIIQAATVGTAYDEALGVLKGAGVPIESVEAIGYFRRKFAPDVADIIAKRKSLAEGEMFDSVKVYSSFQKSRTSFDWTVEDEHLLAFATGHSFEDMSKVVADSDQLKKLLNTLPDNKVDALVTMGILGKAPLTSRELITDLVARYELPFSNVNKIFVTDQVKAFADYTQGLKSLVSESTLLQGILREGHTNGWAVTAAQKAANEELKNFVPLSPSLLSRHITPERLNQLEKAGAMYVHPVVRDMLGGLIDISTSPSKMGAVAELAHHLRFLMTNSKKLMLVTPKYFTVNAIGGVIQSFIAGANLLTILPTWHQYLRNLKVGPAAFDNTAKDFMNGMMTERELFLHLKQTGGLNDVIPGIALSGVHPNKGAWNPKNFGTAAAYGYYTLKRFGLYEAIKKGEEQISNLVTEPVMFLGHWANISDNVSKWNTYKTILSDKPLTQAGGFLTTGIYKNFSKDADGLERARHHVDQYFFDYGNMGTMDKTLSQYVFPFWMYMSKNLPSQFRHMATNPGQYMAYHRIHALLNSPAKDDETGLPAGAVNKYTHDAFPIYFKDPNNDYFALHTTSYDPVADGFIGFRNLATDLERLTRDEYTGTDEQQRRQAGGTYKSDFVEKYLQAIYPQWKMAIQGFEFLTGAERDFLTGKSLQEDPAKPVSFLGKEMPPLARLFLEQSIPIAGSLNTINPGNFFGSPLRFTPQGEVESLPKPSVMFGDPRTDKDLKDPGVRLLNPLIGNLGANLDATNQAINMGYTEGDIKALDKQLTLRVKVLSDEYPIMSDKKKEEARQEVENAKNIIYNLRFDLARIKLWREENNVPASRVARELAIKSLNPSELPLPEGEATRIRQSTHKRFNTFDTLVQQERGR